MNSNKNKAFTLIELLAIIVILAIIAVITVPIILNIIENSRKGAASDSALGYKDAIADFYVSRLYDNNDFILQGDYSINEKGELVGRESIYPISFNGTIPTSGYVTIDKGTVTNGCIQINDYSVIIEDKIISNVKKGNCDSPECIIVSNNNNEYEYKYVDDMKTCSTKISINSNEIKYYDMEWIKDNPVYFDPTRGKCTETDYKNNEENLNKTGCMKWYAYSENPDKTINMILDHNTTAKIEWLKTDDYSIQIGNIVGITYPEDYEFTQPPGHSSGPITALKQLKLDTDSWMDELKRNDTYEEKITNKYGNKIEYTINYQNYKARLLTAEEVATITYAFYSKENGGLGFTMNDTTQVFFYLDGKQGTAQNWKTKIHSTKGASSYSWLFDNNGKDSTHLCQSYGCTYNPPQNMYTYGYWTSSANAGSRGEAWTIDYDGTLYNNSVSNKNRGIRPVITVNKNIIFN